MKRRYGFYYDLQEVTLISFDDDSREAHLITGMLDESLMDKDEKLFQQLWKTYFKAICIKERMNPRKHKQDMPVRYWKYLTEKQTGLLIYYPVLVIRNGLMRIVVHSGLRRYL